VLGRTGEEKGERGPKKLKKMAQIFESLSGGGAQTRRREQLDLAELIMAQNTHTG